LKLPTENFPPDALLLNSTSKGEDDDPAAVLVTVCFLVAGYLAVETRVPPLKRFGNIFKYLAAPFDLKLFGFFFVENIFPKACEYFQIFGC